MATGKKRRAHPSYKVIQGSHPRNKGPGIGSRSRRTSKTDKALERRIKNFGSR